MGRYFAPPVARSTVPPCSKRLPIGVRGYCGQLPYLTPRHPIQRSNLFLRIVETRLERWLPERRRILCSRSSHRRKGGGKAREAAASYLLTPRLPIQRSNGSFVFAPQTFRLGAGTTASDPLTPRHRDSVRFSRGVVATYREGVSLVGTTF